jgi:predicted metal-dependent enzyme (double-stranded beta helix superfamily)
MSRSGTETGLGWLVGAAEGLLRPGDALDAPVTDAVVAQLDEVFRAVLGDPALLPAGITAVPPPYGFAKYLLHAGPAFVIFSTVTAPEVAAPIHDHGSWGLVGLYRGVEEEVRYRLDNGDSGDSGSPGGPGTAVREAGRSNYATGDVMFIEPPPDDIHQVFNRGDSPSVAVHLFRGDLVASGFRLFEAPDYCPRHTGPLQYDAVP